MKAVINSLVVSIAAVSGLIGSINVAQAGVTGNIGVVSNYILRGITETYNATYDNSGPESDSPAHCKVVLITATTVVFMRGIGFRPSVIAMLT
jgi:hypothetical protein